ncbi:toll/interleukin-1 receptor domain-containing protein [Sphingomonas sp. RIT328]|uniref:toll/interleukin-1 receptor domain-containing protein n=1 Tax=Sphingomonas sp. RIT328 TaxID=1470591 RepID=UPI001F2E7693|nr:toll/interleukin-1 receptor domain-containing protein [Sphingomonas sp. RIT328]
MFLSHQRHDSHIAGHVAFRLRSLHMIDCYLDVIDPYVGGPVETLADHIREEMGKCTQLLAIVSASTSTSQWVPWEIGVATEKSFPLATYSGQNHLPPEFLRKWPYLRSDADLDEYARVSKRTERTLLEKRARFGESVARRSATGDFYSELRAALRQ